MDNPTAKISVLVPTYNVAGFLRQCLNSLVGQTLRDIEIIVIDDGSTDRSGSIADEFANRDNRVHVIHKANSGYGDSMNHALATANAPWIAICEPDDYAEPTMCERLLRCAELLEEQGVPVDLVKACYTRIIDDGRGNINELPCAFTHNVHTPHQPFSIDECPLLLTAHPSIWSALYRKAFLDEFDIRFLPIPGAGWADNPFFIETMVAARAIAFLDESVYNYREFEDGTISHLRDWSVITNRWAEMDAVLEAYDAKAPSILEGHYVRGCAYLQMLANDFDQRNPRLVAAARAMAGTFDHGIICRSSLISKEYKLAYARFIPMGKRASLLASWVALHLRALASRIPQ